MGSNIEINNINEFLSQICKLCQEYVKQQLNDSNWSIPDQFKPPLDDKKVCLLCKSSNLKGDSLVFEDLKFFDLIDPNSEVELDNLNFEQFDLNLLLKLIKIDFKARIIALQNENFNFEDLSFSSSKIVPLGFDFYVISNIIKNPKNHNNFKNLIQIHFHHSFTFNSFILSLNNINNTCTINNKRVIKIDGKDVLVNNLREVVLGIFLGEYQRVRESKLMMLFSKVCQDKLLMEQLSRIKINVNFEPNFENRGNYFHCSLHITRDIISFTGYYNKFSRNMSQTPWLIDNQMINNVEKCIGLPLKLICKGSNYKLISCGREDVNVRNLGMGRRVSIEVSNSKIDLFLLFFILFQLQNRTFCISNSNMIISSNEDDSISSNEDDSISSNKGDDKLLRDYFTCSFSTTSMCNANTSNNEVVKFKNVKVEVNSRMIRKEMQKKSEINKKRYNCLIFSESEMEFKSVRLLESKLKFPLRIKQKNPIRISHRRSQDERIKSIFKIKLNPISPRLILVDLITEAGVYVKEFVNGDLGRSCPDLASMIGAGQLRLLFLDVVSSDFEINKAE